MRVSVREQDQRIKRLVALYVSGEVSREHFQSRKADYEEVKLSKLEALKALEEDAKDQRVVLNEALVILGDLPALFGPAWMRRASKPGSRCFSRSW